MLKYCVWVCVERSLCDGGLADLEDEGAEALEEGEEGGLELLDTDQKGVVRGLQFVFATGNEGQDQDEQQDEGDGLFHGIFLL